MTPLPCPFCKATDARALASIFSNLVVTEWRHRVTCSCGAEGASRTTEPDAIAAWNDRPRERELAAERAENVGAFPPPESQP